MQHSGHGQVALREGQPDVNFDIATFHNRYDNLESYGTVILTFPSAPRPHKLVSEYYDNGLRGISNAVGIRRSFFGSVNWTW